MKLRPRKQPLLKLAVFLLLGAIVNVAVAWGCELSHSLRTEEKWTPEALEQGAYLRGLCGYKEIDAGRDESSVVMWRGIGATTLVALRVDGQICGATAGWPLRALFGCFVLDSDLLNPQFQCAIAAPSTVGPLEVADSELRVLPLQPLWPGFAINTIFYAAILGLLFFASGPIRRFIRVKRHRCAACGYQIAKGVGPVCSECGHPLTRHAADAAQQEKT